MQHNTNITGLMILDATPKTNLMRFILIFLVLLISSCAATPEQIQAKASNLTDEALCTEVALQNLTAGFYVNELKSRRVNCNNHKDIIIERRRQEIQQGIQLMALGDALSGRPVQQRSASNFPLPTYFPDFSKEINAKETNEKEKDTSLVFG